MTIHKSKGLEFPVVIIAGMDKKRNIKSSSEMIRTSEKMGIGIDIIDDILKYKYPSIYKEIIGLEKTKEEKEEELRILYVAMTRAKEKLIMTAKVKSVEKLLQKLNESVKLNIYNNKLSSKCIMSIDTYLEIIMMSLTEAYNTQKVGKELEIKIDKNDFLVYSKSVENVIKINEKSDIKIGDIYIENIGNLELKDLTKSQIFYKYFLENEELNDENIKNIFCYFVEIEVSDLLKGNVYKASKIYENKIKNIFEYGKLKNLIVYKLENKLNNYVRNCGKYNYHMENGDIATSDINMRNRQTEAFLRSMIGVSSFGYFSLRNILGVNDDDFYETEEDLTKAKKDITIKKIFEEVVDKSFEKKGIHNIKENLEMFYGDSFDKANEDELKQFFVNMLNAITSIRHRVVHYNMNTNSENIFNFSDIEVSRLLKNIFEKETDKRELKLKIFRQLNSAGVFDYWESWKIKKYLENIKFEFVNKNIPFVPSFTKLYNRIDDLKAGNALKLGNHIIIPKRKEARDSQIYLLKNIYYGKFVEEFIKNNDNFEKIFREIIEINKNAGTNKQTNFYKLEKFEKLKANTPTEYLEKLQSLHKINYNREKIEEDNI